MVKPLLGDPPPSGGDNDPPLGECACCAALTPRVTAIEGQLAALSGAYNGSIVYSNEGVLAVLAPPAGAATLCISATGVLYWLPD